MELVDKLAPDFVIGSPPCTPFCAWNQFMNFRKMDQAKVDKIMEDGRVHLEFMCKVYWKQIRAGRYFVHEHPATAVSWNEKAILRLMMHADVTVVKADQCQYGLKTH